MKRITTSAMQKIFTFVRNADAMPGNDSRKTSRLKKASLTSGQPGRGDDRDDDGGEEDGRRDERDRDGTAAGAAAP